jgi:parallel beta-helix repeat protein
LTTTIVDPANNGIISFGETNLNVKNCQIREYYAGILCAQGRIISIEDCQIFLTTTGADTNNVGIIVSNALMLDIKNCQIREYYNAIVSSLNEEVNIENCQVSLIVTGPNSTNIGINIIGGSITNIKLCQVREYYLGIACTAGKDTRVEDCQVSITTTGPEFNNAGILITATPVVEVKYCQVRGYYIGIVTSFDKEVTIENCQVAIATTISALDNIGIFVPGESIFVLGQAIANIKNCQVREYYRGIDCNAQTTENGIVNIENCQVFITTTGATFDNVGISVGIAGLGTIISVRNCQVREYYRGINFDQARIVNVENCQVYIDTIINDIDNIGIYMFNGLSGNITNVIIQHCQIRGYFQGINCEFSRELMIKDCQIYRDVLGTTTVNTGIFIIGDNSMITIDNVQIFNYLTGIFNPANDTEEIMIKNTQIKIGSLSTASNGILFRASRLLRFENVQILNYTIGIDNSGSQQLIFDNIQIRSDTLLTQTFAVAMQLSSCRLMNINNAQTYNYFAPIDADLSQEIILTNSQFWLDTSIDNATSRLSFDNVNMIAIDNCQVRNYRYGIFVRNSYEVEITNCKVSLDVYNNTDRLGIIADFSAFDDAEGLIIIKNCQIRNYQVGIATFNGHENLIDNVQILVSGATATSSTTSIGIDSRQSFNVQISNATIRNYFTAISARDSVNLTIDNAEILWRTSTVFAAPINSIGIQCSTDRLVHITDSEISGYFTGIGLSGGRNIYIESNQISGSTGITGTGILLNNSVAGILNKNVIFNYAFGLSATGATGLNITNNNITNGGTGISFDGSSSNLIADNNISNNSVVGISFFNSTASCIEDNCINNNGTGSTGNTGIGGVSLRGLTEAICVDNNCFNLNVKGLEVITPATNININDNKFTRNGVGLDLDLAVGILYTDNRFLNNGTQVNPDPPNPANSAKNNIGLPAVTNN